MTNKQHDPAGAPVFFGLVGMLALIAAVTVVEL